jgi:hypothetical protein
MPSNKFHIPCAISAEKAKAAIQTKIEENKKIRLREILSISELFYPVGKFNGNSFTLRNRFGYLIRHPYYCSGRITDEGNQSYISCSIEIETNYKISLFVSGSFMAIITVSFLLLGFPYIPLLLFFILVIILVAIKNYFRKFRIENEKDRYRRFLESAIRQEDH